MPDPDTLAQVDVVMPIVTVGGMNILILPDDVRGSRVVTVNVYDVSTFTVLYVRAIDPLKLLSVAITVVVPDILGYPLFRIYSVMVSVYLTEGGAV